MSSPWWVSWAQLWTSPHCRVPLLFNELKPVELLGLASRPQGSRTFPGGSEGFPPSSVCALPCSAPQFRVSCSHLTEAPTGGKPPPSGSEFIDVSFWVIFLSWPRDECPLCPFHHQTRHSHTAKPWMVHWCVVGKCWVSGCNIQTSPVSWKLKVKSPLEN